MASERTMVSGSRTGSMTSVPAANAVATGRAAGRLAADEADRPSLDQPELGELLEARARRG